MRPCECHVQANNVSLPDLDSLTSSILYAYIRSLSPSRTAFTPLYIPLLNIPAADISLRPEYTALFQHANISASHLITLDDLPAFSKLEENLKPTNTSWILVDHNSLQGTLGSIYGSRVGGVIDHHEEENFVPHETDPEPRIIEESGSCTSLVVRTFRSVWDASSSSSLISGAAHAQAEAAIDDSAVIQTWDAQVAKLALASILIDTVNLTAEGKVFPADRDAVEYLEMKIQSSAREARTWNRAEFYEEINAAKGDIEGLALNDILRKDYKEWMEDGKKLGISSLVKPLKFLVSKAREENPQNHKEDCFDTAISGFMSARDISIFAIMTTSTSKEKGFQRELLLQARPAVATIASKFSAQAGAELRLEELNVPGVFEYNTPAEEHEFRKVWIQRDVSKSRKQVAPLLRKAMR